MVESIFLITAAPWQVLSTFGSFFWHVIKSAAVALRTAIQNARVKILASYWHTKIYGKLI